MSRLAKEKRNYLTSVAWPLYKEKWSSSLGTLGWFLQWNLSVRGIPEINLQKYNQFDHSGQRSTIHRYYPTSKKATEDSTLWMETGHWWYDCGKFYLSEPLILSCLHLNAAGLERTSAQGLHCSKVFRKDSFLWLAARYGWYDYGNVIRIHCMLPILLPDQFSVSPQSTWVFPSCFLFFQNFSLPKSALV